MKWLETSPKDYDRGIQILTLGQLQQLKEAVVKNYVREGTRILEIGCGTGTLAVMMAKSGGRVTGIDSSPKMLAVAESKVASEGLEQRITLEYIDATLVAERFPLKSYDLIVSTMVLSELSGPEQRYVLEASAELLAPGGRILIADEVIPSRILARILYYFVHLPLVLITWLLTRTTTRPLHDFEILCEDIGLRCQREFSYLGGSLALFEINLTEPIRPVDGLPPGVVGRLCHRVTLRSVLTDIWTLFFRIIPPYPKVHPGLYAVGHPTPDSPVLVTGNFDLTVRRLVKAIDGEIDAWVLVADSSGINVWCAAGGGFFTADSVIAAVKSSHLDQVVDHHALILPQLCANGVDGWRIRDETGWGVHWGPVRAEDIPAYLNAKRKKSDEMRWVRFPVQDRLEMVTVTLGFYGLLILLPVLLFWRSMFWPITYSLITISLFYAIVHPWLPGRDGLYKSIPLTMIVLVGLLIYTSFFHPMPGNQLFNWMVGLTGLSVFVGAELQGMSPLMRGEQANWGWEVIIGLILVALYWLVPIAAGWR